jgi:GNAT superfamily N-acetyltransferase
MPEPNEPLHAGYEISTDKTRLDPAAIHAYLSRSYWSPGIPREVVDRAIANSLCFGLYDAHKTQIGFARVVTDTATFAYLADVYVLENHQGKGLGKWLIKTIVSHPSLTSLRRFLLATRDAHTLYEKYGFQPLSRPERFMEIFRPDIYKITP